MPLSNPGKAGAFRGNVFRDPFSIMSPRFTGFIDTNPFSPHSVVNVGTAESPIAWPEDPDSAGNAWDKPYVIQMGAGDGLEIVGGGSDADNELHGLICYVLDEVVDGDGNVIAFTDRQLFTATFTLGSTTLGASDPLVVAFEEIESGDFIMDVASVAGSPPPGVFAINPGAGVWGSLIIEGRQSQFLRFSLSPMTGTAGWFLSRRLQGDALGAN